MITSRRAFLTGLVAAPAVLRLGLYMPVRKWIEPVKWRWTVTIAPKVEPPLFNNLTLSFSGDGICKYSYGEEIGIIMNDNYYNGQFTVTGIRQESYI
jgi:hypothetical protein